MDLFVEKAYAMGWNPPAMVENVSASGSGATTDTLLSTLTHMCVTAFSLVMGITIAIIVIKLIWRMLSGGGFGLVAEGGDDIPAGDVAQAKKQEELKVEPILEEIKEAAVVKAVESSMGSAQKKGGCSAFELDTAVAAAIAEMDMSRFEDYKD